MLNKFLSKWLDAFKVENPTLFIVIVSVLVAIYGGIEYATSQGAAPSWLSAILPYLKWVFGIVGISLNSSTAPFRSKASIVLLLFLVGGFSTPSLVAQNQNKTSLPRSSFYTRAELIDAIENLGQIGFSTSWFKPSNRTKSISGKIISLDTLAAAGYLDGGGDEVTYSSSEIETDALSVSVEETTKAVFVTSEDVTISASRSIGNDLILQTNRSLVLDLSSSDWKMIQVADGSMSDGTGTVTLGNGRYVLSKTHNQYWIYNFNAVEGSTLTVSKDVNQSTGAIGLNVNGNVTSLDIARQSSVILTSNSIGAVEISALGFGYGFQIGTQLYVTGTGATMSLSNYQEAFDYPIFLGSSMTFICNNGTIKVLDIPNSSLTTINISTNYTASPGRWSISRNLNNGSYQWFLIKQA